MICYYADIGNKRYHKKGSVIEILDYIFNEVAKEVFGCEDGDELEIDYHFTPYYHEDESKSILIYEVVLNETRFGYIYIEHIKE